ncbi:MAG TPA: Gfo/Idh/MocA family oxidoreductase, partial [Chloroflexota bacterium]|nr:Gfo/Idh/MocA family oxidoreductase [Chloroflexota bacterium]
EGKRRIMTTIAFVGCAHIHTPGFIKKVKQRPGIQVKSAWDHEVTRGRKRAEELGAQFVESVDQIWGDGGIEAVVICSETNRHVDLVRGGAEAGKDLFVEKPLGIGAADSYAMASAIEAARVRFQTGYFQRGDPMNQFLKRQIEQGNFGTITRVRGSNAHGGALGGWFDRQPPEKVESDWRWMADPEIAGVGAFGDLGTHALDILLWWLGDVESGIATLDTGTNRYDGCDETGESLLRFKNGTIGTLAAAWDDVADPVKYLISGTEGHAAVIEGKLYFTSKRVSGADGKQPWADLPPAHPAGFDAFLDAIEGKEATLVSPREAAYRSAVMEALYEAARTGAWVRPQSP